jgi:hypothetical protein
MSGDAAADAARLADALAAMEGAEAWQVFLGYGSNLFIDLGRQIELRGQKKTRIVGELTLWVNLAAWRLQDAARVLVACEDPRPVIADKITVLRGRRVTAVTVTPPAMEAVFDFDGVRLLVFPVHSETGSASEGRQNTQWSLWRPQGDIVSVSPGSGEAWTIKPSTARATQGHTSDGPHADPAHQ